MFENPDPSKPIVLVVLSGGQDSTTCLALALRDNPIEDVYAITFNYGQRHAAEIGAATKIASLAFKELTGGHHEVIDVPQVLHGSSPLVNPGEKVESYASAETLPGGLEKTFVPMRNTLFLTIAANRAVLLAQRFGRSRAIIVTGVSQEDYGGYPDCRRQFIEDLNHAFTVSLDDPQLPELIISTPLMHLDKEYTVRLSERIPGARELLRWSHTCYNGQVPPCGKCHACLLRAKGYAKAGITDPLVDRFPSVQTGSFT